MKKVNYDLAEDILKDTGATIIYEDGKYHLCRDGVKYYDAPTKEELISIWANHDLSEYEYEVVEKILPYTLNSLPLLNEPATAKDRRLCLRQLEENKWCVCYYSEPDDEFVQGHYFNTWVEASEYYQGEIARYTAHWQELVDKLYEMERA